MLGVDGKVNVGVSFTAVTETCPCTAVEDKEFLSSFAFSVKAFKVPFASCAGVQYALFVLSIVSFVPLA